MCIRDRAREGGPLPELRVATGRLADLPLRSRPGAQLPRAVEGEDRRAGAAAAGGRLHRHLRDLQDRHEGPLERSVVAGPDPDGGAAAPDVQLLPGDSAAVHRRGEAGRGGKPNAQFHDRTLTPATSRGGAGRLYRLLSTMSTTRARGMPPNTVAVRRAPQRTSRPSRQRPPTASQWGGPG